MKNNLVKYICAASLVFAPVVGYSADTTTTQSGDKGVESGASTASSGPSVNDSADKTSDKNSSGQAMSYLTGGMFMAMGASDISAGYSSSPVGWGLVAKGVFEVMLGMLSMQQGKAHGKAAGQASGTGFNTDGFGDLGGNSSNEPYGLDDPNNPLNKDPQFAAIKGNIAKLEQMGVLDSKTGTAKVGDKTYKMSDFASKDAMAAAGVPPGAIAGLMDLAGDVEKKAKEKYDKLKLGAMTAANGYAEGGGGGGGFGAGLGSSDDSSGSSAGLGSGGLGSGAFNRDPANLAGMQKNYNGEPIGVAADSIFLMMTRRYKVKESQESFFSDAELAIQK
ncbi:hypothetical protein EZJ49_06350 [Bdellovibrio bacteriovorus]|uniref:hypothetical protein n=1 Tax=Bdellovibrio bacteriovorus TaxID=959 RepID=UPI0021CF8BCD|nr:hypothetical protein [Bdellovibrio bacteriovorus]UXR65868.1 hypothetical protein EZJ49_06350 [Bdellovibrio bacteriovorus]